GRRRAGDGHGAGPGGGRPRALMRAGRALAVPGLIALAAGLAWRLWPGPAPPVVARPPAVPRRAPGRVRPAPWPPVIPVAGGVAVCANQTAALTMTLGARGGEIRGRVIDDRGGRCQARSSAPTPRARRAGANARAGSCCGSCAATAPSS